LVLEILDPVTAPGEAELPTLFRYVRRSNREPYYDQEWRTETAMRIWLAITS
jgi:hypothetical protein